jgi:hypothetical protein
MHSPVGDLTVFEDEANIVALEWGWVAKQSQTTLLNRAVEQLVAYMNSELQHFDLPLRPTALRTRRWCGRHSLRSRSAQPARLVPWRRELVAAPALLAKRTGATLYLS